MKEEEKKVSAYIPESLAKRLEQFAKEEGVSLSKLVGSALDLGFFFFEEGVWRAKLEFDKERAKGDVSDARTREIIKANCFPHVS